MESVLRLLEQQRAERLFVFTDRAAGLRAFLAIDDLRLGPAAGGTRTMSYASPLAAIQDASELARAMTLKCSLAGLDAGGAKMVVMDHAGLDRAAAFDTLGRRIAELDGLFVTAGDLGTTATDLRAMAAHSSYVRTDEPDLAAAVAVGLRHCAAACARFASRDGLAGLTVAVQGCGAVGSAVAATLHDAGAQLLVADIDSAAAKRVAARTGATIVAPAELLASPVDLLAPCAGGGVITAQTVEQVHAWAICGAANNVLAEPTLGERLSERGILLVPDVIASAGAVIRGICALHGRDDESALIAALGDTTRHVLELAAAQRRPTPEVAEQLAVARLEAAASRSPDKPPLPLP